MSNSLLTIVHDILPLLNLEKLESDATSSTPVGLSCTDLADDGVCENVPSCCTEETIVSHFIVLGVTFDRQLLTLLCRMGLTLFI